MPAVDTRLMETLTSFSPDGSYLATTNGTDVYLFDSMSGSLVQSLDTDCAVQPPDQRIRLVSFSHNDYVVVVCSDQTIQWWNIKTGRKVGPLKTSSAREVTELQISPPGDILAVGHADGTVRLWEIAAARPVGNLLAGHTGAVTDIKFDAVRPTMATASSDGTIRFWNY